MKKIVLVSIAVASLMYAHNVTSELEQTIKTTVASIETPSQDMSQMKAMMSKCGGNQQKKKSMMHQHGTESPKEDISKMQGMDKCSANQKSNKGMMHQHKDKNTSVVELGKIIKTPPSDKNPKVNMAKMKAMGKCGSHK